MAIIKSGTACILKQINVAIHMPGGKKVGSSNLFELLKYNFSVQLLEKTMFVKISLWNIASCISH